jgi:glycosyltransferase involved in cell wall biosynthesis
VIPVAIPAYQAAGTIADVVRRARRFAERVVVVDDGSTDGTAGAARAAGAHVLSHSRNLGKGRALATALDSLFAEHHAQVVTLDADGQHLPEEIPKLVGAARAGADLVIGSRYHLFARMHAIRRFSNRWSSRLISAAAGHAIADVQSGFRLYSRHLYDAVGLPEPRFEAESAVLVRAARLGFTVTTVPIELGFVDGRSTSHYRPVMDSLRIFGAVARARLETVGCPSERSS